MNDCMDKVDEYMHEIDYRQGPAYDCGKSLGNVVCAVRDPTHELHVVHVCVRASVCARLCKVAGADSTGEPLKRWCA